MNTKNQSYTFPPVFVMAQHRDVLEKLSYEADSILQSKTEEYNFPTPSLYDDAMRIVGKGMGKVAEVFRSVRLQTSALNMLLSSYSDFVKLNTDPVVTNEIGVFVEDALNKLFESEDDDTSEILKLAAYISSEVASLNHFEATTKEKQKVDEAIRRMYSLIEMVQRNPDFDEKMKNELVRWIDRALHNFMSAAISVEQLVSERELIDKAIDQYLVEKITKSKGEVVEHAEQVDDPRLPEKADSILGEN